VVTERWSARKYVQAKSAERGWDVTGVADEEAARQAVGAAAAPGAQFPLDNRLWVLTAPEVTRTGPASYFVRAQFAFPKSGTFTPPDRSPLDMPTKWLWDSGVISEPTDVDADNLVLINSAGLPFSGLTADIPYLILVATRNEFRYDIAKAIAYSGTFNTDSFTIPLTPGPVEPGQALCISYKPTRDYDATSQYVPVAYTLWLRKGNVKDADNYWDSWKHRLRDQGKTGWYSKSGTITPGGFTGDGNKRPDEPVLLDGTGKPLNTQWKVEGNSPVSPTSPVLDPRLVEKTGTTAVYLKYRKHKGMPFSGLGIF
jgi:hypothetical protein